MSYGPCLCGDTQCPSCGPAQGNYRCAICHVWADDGCEHLDEEAGHYKEEFQKQIIEAETRDKEELESMARELSMPVPIWISE